MNCEEYLILIDDLIEDEPDNQNSGQVNSHLLVCPPCADYYRSARREKEIYAGFLSGIEPPSDLWTKFQAKMDSESETVAPVSETAAATGWMTNWVGFFRPAAALGFASVLIALGIGWLNYEPDTNDYTAKNELNSFPAASENYDLRTPDLPAQADARKITASPKSTEINRQREISSRSTNKAAVSKAAADKAPKTSRKKPFDGNRKESSADARLNEKRLRLAALEKDAAQQIEKTELLLRAFRNARTGEGDARDDLEYERQQARKLLEKNVQLRQFAESYGDLYTQELLDKIEPFLLDIANLEKSPSPEKVSDIQKRVKNQNIIASLQIY